MSVIMTFRVQGDPEKLEQLARENPNTLSAITFWHKLETGDEIGWGK